MPRALESNNLLIHFRSRFLMSFKLINPAITRHTQGFFPRRFGERLRQLLFVAGQIGWDEQQKIVSDSFVEQFDRALANVVAVVNEAGGAADRDCPDGYLCN